MALDGIVLSNIVSDLQKTLIGGRILKIYQTEQDEIIVGVRSQGVNYQLLLTAHSNYPRIHFTNQNKDNPQSPPMFCMLLRKHIGGGRITEIVQPDFERIVEIYIKSPNDLGDLTDKKLVIEIMGRHSNIILVDDKKVVIDSIKHVGKMQSSVRQVFPGSSYTYPPSQNKCNPLERSFDIFKKSLDLEKPMRIQRRLFTLFTGMSPLIASEICFRAKIDPVTPTDEITPDQQKTIYQVLDALYVDVENKDYKPGHYQDQDDKILAFSSMPLTSFYAAEKVEHQTVSLMLDHVYSHQSQTSRVGQKTANMRKILESHQDRALRKKEFQLNALEEVKQRDQYRVWGELLTANSHSVPSHADNFITTNYYDPDMSDIEIPLDPQKNAIENAQSYFKTYNKAKRTEVAAKKQLRIVKLDLLYLDSLFSTLETLEDENDIEEFRTELVESGYLSPKRVKRKKRRKKPKPLHFVSQDGFHIYVGKNNIQNDHLTLHTARNHDLWFHTKDIPGSHVIVVTGRHEVPETTLIEAAQLAAFYSKAKASSNVPVDYAERKYVRKPNGAKPGMVIYDNNKTLYVTPEKRLIDGIKVVG